MGELAAGKLPLAEIALNAHFSSQASFTRAFHRVTGMTPKEYQRSHAIMPTLLASTGVRILPNFSARGLRLNYLNDYQLVGLSRSALSIG